MNIVMESGNSYDELSQSKWDIAFYGESKDERCCKAIDQITAIATTSYLVKYEAPNSTIHFGNSIKCLVDDLIDHEIISNINENSKILLECTSLGIVEMLLLLQATKDKGIRNIYVLYLEPLHYKRFTKNFIERRQFNITKHFDGFLGIPGHTLVSENRDKALVLCGYEAERLGRLFDNTEIQGKNCQLIFGVPPYVVGWDMNSYTNYLPIIENYHISSEFYYCGACNPLAVYNKLEKVFSAIEEDQKLFILPFGTKPMALGACLFKITHDDGNIAILYDHPTKIEESSFLIANWNLFIIKYD